MKVKEHLSGLSSGDTTLPYSEDDQVDLSITNDQLFPALQAGFETIISLFTNISLPLSLNSSLL